jgi:hypothetical protein
MIKGVNQIPDNQLVEELNGLTAERADQLKDLGANAARIRNLFRDSRAAGRKTIMRACPHCGIEQTGKRYSDHVNHCTARPNAPKRGRRPKPQPK